jgi:diacylglycerol kinase family enzyme
LAKDNAIVALLETGQVRRVDVGVARNGAGRDLFLSHRSYGLLEQIQHTAERGRRQPRHRLLRYLFFLATRLHARQHFASLEIAALCSAGRLRIALSPAEGV